MIFSKGVHHSATFQTFDCSSEVSPNLYLDRLPLIKVYKVPAKKVWRKYLMMPKSGAKFEEKLIFCFKNNKNLVTFISPFCAKYITFDLKKYRGVIYHDTKESCQI